MIRNKNYLRDNVDGHIYGVNILDFDINSISYEEYLRRKRIYHVKQEIFENRIKHAYKNIYKDLMESNYFKNLNNRIELIEKEIIYKNKIKKQLKKKNINNNKLTNDPILNKIIKNRIIEKNNKKNNEEIKKNNDELIEKNLIEKKTFFYLFAII